MHSAKVATILFLLALIASPTLALTQKQAKPTDEAVKVRAQQR